MSSPTQSLAFAFGIGALTAAVSGRLRIPAVLPLLLAGVVCGRSGLGLVDLDSVGPIFRSFVAIAIGLLVFEGGLHLDRKELSRAPRAVIGLLTIGSLATLALTALVGQWVLQLDWPLAVVLGSLVVVTGPTVVQPILRTVRVSPRVSAVLGAEAILIDPIGVICAVAALDVSLAYYRGAFEGSWPGIVAGFGIPFASGLGIGVLFGGLGLVLFKVLGPRASPNVAAFGIAMLSFAVGENVTHEGGLVAATVAGVILSNLQVVKTSDLRRFKEQIATILVGMLFVLLASAIDVEALRALGAREYAAAALILFAVRPVSVLFSTFGSRLDWRERVFVALFAPRGVAAVSLTALTVAELQRFFAEPGDGTLAALSVQATNINSVVILLVVASVVWATAASWPLAWLLRILGRHPGTVVVVGAHALGRDLALALRGEGVAAVLVDSNLARVVAARGAGVDAEHLDATDPNALHASLRDRDAGWLFAWTGNVDVDRVVARWAAAQFGERAVSQALPSARGSEGSDPLTSPTRAASVRRLDGLLAGAALRVVAVDAADSEDLPGTIIAEVSGGEVVRIGPGEGARRRTRCIMLVEARPGVAPGVAPSVAPGVAPDVAPGAGQVTAEGHEPEGS
jgi:NhaP-type Na+/H+ or K+/H+ antiporter